MRNERRRLIDDPNAGKQARADDNEGLPDAAPSANAATEAPVSEPEVSGNQDSVTVVEPSNEGHSLPCSFILASLIPVSSWANIGFSRRVR